MNVLILFSQPWRYGGGESHVTTLMQGLLAEGHRVVLTFHGAQPVAGLPEGVRQVPLIYRTMNPLAMGRTMAALYRVLEEERIDILHAHQRTACIVAARLGRRMGLPHTVTLHDLWRWYFRNIMHPYWSTLNIAVSERERQYFHTQYRVPLDRFVVIENGIDVAAFATPEAGAVRPRQPDAPYTLLFPARLSQQKGKAAVQLIQAVGLLAAELPVLLRIAGSGPMQDEVTAAAAQANATAGHEIVQTLGQRSDIPDLLRDTDVVVGTGRVAAEAMAAGKPVVALFDDGVFMGAMTPENVAELVRYNFAGPGQPVTPPALRDTLMPLLRDNALRERLGRFAAQYAAEHLSARSMVERTLVVYQTLRTAYRVSR